MKTYLALKQINTQTHLGVEVAFHPLGEVKAANAGKALEAAKRLWRMIPHGLLAVKPIVH